MASPSPASRYAITSRRSIITKPCNGCANSQRKRRRSAKTAYANCIAASSPAANRPWPVSTARFRVRIAGAPVIFPNPLKIPQLMEEFGAWLSSASSTPQGAFEGHFRLTAIHPFGDGNGRTARLLMNLMLIRTGYPPVAVRSEDRKTYLDALERGSLADDLGPFQGLLHERLEATLEEYVSALREALPPA
jgi:Fic family protein